MNCREAIKKIFEDKGGILSTQDVVENIKERFPNNQWKRNTISAHLIGLSVNHFSAKHYAWLIPRAFLYSLGNGRYRNYNPENDGKWKLIDGSPTLIDEEVENDIEDTTYEGALSLERDLEDYLVHNLSMIEDGLKLFQEEEISGQQYRTENAGRIDILALDKEDRYVVIEIKAGTADEKVCGQILRYMGWIKKHLADDCNVRGIIVAHNFSEKMTYAALALPNINLVCYNVNFSFSNKDQIST